MTRRVVIYPDRLGLHALRCVEPCQPGGWCMDMAPQNAGRFSGNEPVRPGCYLGAASSPDLAARMAERWGYSVVEVASSSAASPRNSAAMSA
jgi:hypothetical protein